MQILRRTECGQTLQIGLGHKFRPVKDLMKNILFMNKVCAKIVVDLNWVVMSAIKGRTFNKC